MESIVLKTVEIISKSKLTSGDTNVFNNDILAQKNHIEMNFNLLSDS